MLFFFLLICFPIEYRIIIFVLFPLHSHPIRSYKEDEAVYLGVKIFPTGPCLARARRAARCFSFYLFNNFFNGQFWTFTINKPINNVHACGSMSHSLPYLRACNGNGPHMD